MPIALVCRRSAPRVHRSRPAARVRPSALISSAFVLLFLGWLAASGARASERRQDAPPIGTNELMDSLDEILYLNSLTPLKLNNQTIDKVIAAVESEEKDYQRRIAALGADFSERSSAEIREMKRRALLGTPVPDTFHTKVQALMQQRDAIQEQSLRNLSTALQGILSPEQQVAAARFMQTREKQSTGTTTQWFNYYVLNAILRYPRIVPLLKELRAFNSGANSPSPDANTSAPLSGAPGRTP